MQFLSLNAIGTESFLRSRLRTHLNEIKADDIEIKKEGIEQLTDDELRHACRARGMPAPFGRGCTTFMQKQLRDWIELSLDRCAAGARAVLRACVMACVCGGLFPPVPACRAVRRACICSA